jgi:hypothetical protein
LAVDKIKHVFVEQDSQPLRVLALATMVGQRPVLSESHGIAMDKPTVENVRSCCDKASVGMGGETFGKERFLNKAQWIGSGKTATMMHQHDVGIRLVVGIVTWSSKYAADPDPPTNHRSKCATERSHNKKLNTGTSTMIHLDRD